MLFFSDRAGPAAGVIPIVHSRVANYIAATLLRPGASDLTGSYRCVGVLMVLLCVFLP